MKFPTGAKLGNNPVSNMHDKANTSHLMWQAQTNCHLIIASSTTAAQWTILRDNFIFYLFFSSKNSLAVAREATKNIHINRAPFGLTVLATINLLENASFPSLCKLSKKTKCISVTSNKSRRIWNLNVFEVSRLILEYHVWDVLIFGF